jgi:hypothetical protein
MRFAVRREKEIYRDQHIVYVAGGSPIVDLSFDTAVNLLRYLGYQPSHGFRGIPGRELAERCRTALSGAGPQLGADRWEGFVERCQMALSGADTLLGTARAARWERFAERCRTALSGADTQLDAAGADRWDSFDPGTLRAYFSEMLRLAEFVGERDVSLWWDGMADKRRPARIAGSLFEENADRIAGIVSSV